MRQRCPVRYDKLFEMAGGAGGRGQKGKNASCLMNQKRVGSYGVYGVYCRVRKDREYMMGNRASVLLA